MKAKEETDAATQVDTRSVENWIGGGWHATTQTLDNIDPATGRVICPIPRSQAADIDHAVAVAKMAQSVWAKTPLAARCDVLRKAADTIEARLSDLAAVESEDSGKTITTARTVDIPRAVRNFRFFAEHARELPEEMFDSELGHNYTHRKPIGVVGLITPWNLPLYLLSWKAAPALAMGNAVVAKPSEMTPRTASMLGEILKEAGLPDGLYNVVHGLGPEAGQALVEHPDVGAISFTGGTATGRIVARTAAPMFKKLSLELGGKNPGIVFADHLEDAVEGVVRAGFTNTGQVCLCSSRILVEESVYDDFLARLVERVKNMKVGDPSDPDTELGALISTQHRDKVESYLQVAREEGGTIHCGGERPDLGADHKEGAFLTPAVISGLPQTSRCIQEEIFGPVVTVQRFSDEAEAVRLANDVPYGLAATVWTEDREKAKRVAEALDTGMVWINDWLVRDLRVPFGGMKASGVGREGGRYSLEFFSEARNIFTGYVPSR